MLSGLCVGPRSVAPVTVKIEAIFKFQVSCDKRELMRFLGMAGYYCKFSHSFSTVTEPLIALLRRGETFL